MLGTQHLGLFVLSGLALNITPGQDTLYIVGRSVAQGRRAGVLSVLGISSGAVVHTLAAAFGLSAILATSAHAFTIVRLAGAAYLAYLGLRLMFERPTGQGATAVSSVRSGWALYRAGVLTNLLNPKMALFFLAFLPQFVSPTAESRVLAFLLLGTLFIVNGTAWCLVLVWAASTVRRRLDDSGAAAMRVRRATGTLFVWLGVRLAVRS
jgi:threonine/homoserine/homoserine lactone efflux protein